MNAHADPLVNLRADGAVAVLSFQVEDSSKLTRRFIDAMAALVNAAAKRPLVHTTDRSFMAVYRAANGAVTLSNPDQQGAPLFAGVRRLTDAKPGFRNTITFNAATDTVEVPEGGTWADKRMPESTARYTLPVFDPDATARALVDLVDRWMVAGDAVEAETWREQAIREQKARSVLPTLTERAQAYITVDLRDLDPTDPLRADHALIAEIRRLQAERIPVDRPERGFMRSIIGRVRG